MNALFGVRVGRMVCVGVCQKQFRDNGRLAKRKFVWQCDCGSMRAKEYGKVRYNLRRGWGCCSSCLPCIRASGEPAGALYVAGAA